jgi:electron transport complex protein RnfC
MSARAILRGGLRLESHKTRPLEQPVQRLPAPTTVVLALDQGSGEEARAIVPPGARVRVGTPVAAGREATADLHAPVSGTVRAIEPRPTVGGTGTCIVIDSDGRAERELAAAPLAPPPNLLSGTP